MKSLVLILLAGPFSMAFADIESGQIHSPLESLRRYVETHTAVEDGCPSLLARGGWRPGITQDKSVINMSRFLVRIRETPSVDAFHRVLAAVVPELVGFEGIAPSAIALPKFGYDMDLTLRIFALGHLLGVWEVAGPDTYFPVGWPTRVYLVMMENGHFLALGRNKQKSQKPAYDRSDLAKFVQEHVSVTEVPPELLDWGITETGTFDGPTTDMTAAKFGLMGNPSRDTFLAMVEDLMPASGQELNLRFFVAMTRDVNTALRVMAAGHLLGVWTALTPNIVLGHAAREVQMLLIRNGYFTITANP